MADYAKYQWHIVAPLWQKCKLCGFVVRLGIKLAFNIMPGGNGTKYKAGRCSGIAEPLGDTFVAAAWF